ncbi:unnamed protein product [Rhodiola kirilowii]
MPDTRSTSESLDVFAQSITEITQAMNQLVQTQSNDRNNLTGMMEQLRGEMQELRLANARAGKKPIDDSTGTYLNPPLLPTPSTGIFHPTNATVQHTMAQHPEPHTNAASRVPRIEVPLFSRNAVGGWIFQMERFFEYHYIPPDQQLSVALFYMAGEALEWYCWLHDTHQLRDWPTLAANARSRFGPSVYYSPEEAINKLVQTSSVASYIAEFESLSSQTPGMSASNLLTRFTSGLKDEIHCELVMLRPTTLQVTMGMARLAEQKRAVFQRTLSYRSFSHPSHRLPPSQNHPKLLTPPTSTTLPIKRLTPTKMAARKEKGLCFNCDERYAPGHKCRPRFQCLVLNETPFEEECPVINHVEDEEVDLHAEEHELVNPDTTPNISCHALEGRVAPSTLRLRGQLKTLPIVILVDSGSTHNFLQTRVARKAGLPIEQSTHLNVTIGNGDELQCQGLCRNVELQLGNSTFLIDFHLLPIYGAEAVLGAQWLADLGPVLFDYQKLWMSFMQVDKQIKLFGIQNGKLNHMTFGQLRRATKTNGVASLYQLTVMEWDKDQRPQLPLEIPTIPESLTSLQQDQLKHLLEGHQQVFTAPKGLPPRRTVDHHIPLQEGAAPIKAQPYRYPRYQKLEVERLVKEMLLDGVIQPSNSPFSSPVLLVKK